ncbi:MAG: lamin tail domain-containing protein, partial [Candidatus Marinimicrobia bacterium]|nr:lamin tail domain-containing protein [Candidatus Neomarinimicrobiota bacterium]
YIELFSRALLPVQMRGLRIADMTGEISLNCDYVLMPDSFVVAAQSASFHDDFPFVNNVIYPAAWRGLNNGEDIIRLSGPSGPLICDLRYDSTWDIPDDCAMLLVDTSLEMRGAANWEYSVTGSPGSMNRTRRRMHHLRCLEENMFLPVSETLCLHLVNDGYSPMEEQSLFLSTSSGSQTLALPPTLPGDTVLCFPDTSILFVPGTHACRFATEDTARCSGMFRYYAPFDPSDPPLRFNEVMTNPSDTYGQAEFIELFGTQADCDLENWTIGVNNARLILSGTAGTGFTVICDADDPVLQVPLSRRLSFASFPALPNGGALLVLYDPRGREMDRFDLRDHPGLQPGRSLEKQAETLPSDDPGLWLASVAEGGMSPGVRNSVTPLPGQRYALSVFPEIFQPGADAALQITVDSETPLSCCELYCFNAAGQTVFRMERSLFSQPSALIFWDGKTQNGSYPARGLYLLCAVLHDHEGGSLSLRKTFAIR